MLATHKDAEERYTTIRQAVIDEANQQFIRNGQHGLKAKLIDASALNASTTWNASSRRHVDWDWIQGYNDFRFRHPKRFEMALWQGQKLASLTLGRPTYMGARLRLDYIEGNPDKSEDIQVFQFTFIAMAIYANALGADELRIMNPINKTVRGYYERFGFSYIAKGNYLTIRL